MTNRKVNKLQHHLWTAHGLNEAEIDFDHSSEQHERLHQQSWENWPDNAERHNPDYIKTTEDGRYGLSGPSGGYSYLWKITEGEHFMVGAVMDPENIEHAALEADEESRVLMAQAREEFGLESGISSSLS